MNKENNDYLSKNQPEGEPDFDKINRLNTNLNTRSSPLQESVEEYVTKLYQYFPNKEDIIKFLIAKHFEHQSHNSAETSAQYAKYDTLVDELDNKIIGYVADVERLRAQNERCIEIFKWLLGHYDFPEPPKEGRPRYYWRSHLQDKLKESGIEIKNIESPFQKRETDI